MVSISVVSAADLKLEEIEEIGRLFQEWKKVEPNYRRFLLSNSYFVLARESGALVGGAQLTFADDPFCSLRWGLVEKIYVRSLYQRKGIAKEIMRNLMVQAEALGCSFVCLYTESWNKPAQEMYERLGFVRHYSYFKTIRTWNEDGSIIRSLA